MPRRRPLLRDHAKYVRLLAAITLRQLDPKVDINP
jgi:hypothetical protein